MRDNDNSLAMLVGAVLACLLIGIGYLLLENHQLKTRVTKLEERWHQAAEVEAENFSRAATTSKQSNCINNLRQLDGAIQQWALENKQSSAAPVYIADIQEYLQAPIECPEAGTYAVTQVGDPPTCSAPGHSLP